MKVLRITAGIIDLLHSEKHIFHSCIQSQNVCITRIRVFNVAQLDAFMINEAANLSLG